MNEKVCVGWKRKMRDDGLIVSNVGGYYKYIKCVIKETVLYETSDRFFLDYLVRTRNTFEPEVWE